MKTLQKYKGQLTAHVEMCCGTWPQFHDDRGLHGDKKQYFSWPWTINFGSKTQIDRLVIYDTDDSVLYEGPWTYSRKNSAEGFPSPKEIDAIQWHVLCSRNLRTIIETTEVVEALVKKDTRSNKQCM